MIYFDHNATTPLAEPVLEAMRPFLGGLYANPSSLYRSARIIRSAIDTARQQVAEFVNASPSQVVFTSGGTEANNLAIKGRFDAQPFSRMCIAAFEHPSVLQPAQFLQSSGVNLRVLDIDPLGYVNFDQLLASLSDGVGLVSIMTVNNETGVIQQIQDIATICRQQGALLHTDAVQAAGKLEIDFNGSGVNLLSLSSHKLYGPKGCGVLVVDKQTNLSPLLHGGGQEQGLRGGTENVAAIVGFGKAAELAGQQLQQRIDRLQHLSNKLLEGLQAIPGILIFGDESNRVCNTLQFGIPNTDGEMLLMQLDKQGIAVSSGSACASGGGQASHVLTAMGVSETMAKSAIRISLGHSNTEQEIEIFLSSLKNLLLEAI